MQPREHRSFADRFPSARVLLVAFLLVLLDGTGPYEPATVGDAHPDVLWVRWSPEDGGLLVAETPGGPPIGGFEDAEAAADVEPLRPSSRPPWYLARRTSVVDEWTTWLSGHLGHTVPLPEVWRLCHVSVVYDGETWIKYESRMAGLRRFLADVSEMRAETERTRVEEAECESELRKLMEILDVPRRNSAPADPDTYDPLDPRLLPDPVNVGWPVLWPERRGR